MDKYSPKILLFDIETTPLIGYTWGVYEQNLIRIIQYSYILCVSYKWFGKKSVHNVALPDFDLYDKDPKDDSELVKVLHGLFNEADIVIAHNGDRFDQRVSNARFIENGLLPPEPYATVDTLKVARSKFKFASNKLNDLGVFLELGEKEKHAGFDTWEGCMSGDEKAWKTMKKYNNQDVLLLEQVYLKLLPWITNHPAINSISGIEDACPNCGQTGMLIGQGHHVLKSGAKKRRYQCTNCGHWCSDRRAINKGTNLYV